MVEFQRCLSFGGVELLDILTFPVVYMSPATLNTPGMRFSASVSTVRSFTVISFAISRWFVPP
jgi:hypothetical protein